MPTNATKARLLGLVMSRAKQQQSRVSRAQRTLREFIPTATPSLPPSPPPAVVHPQPNAQRRPRCHHREAIALPAQRRMCWRIWRLHQAAEECVLAKKGTVMFFWHSQRAGPSAFVSGTGEAKVHYWECASVHLCPKHRGLAGRALWVLRPKVHPQS